jgi:hypothetical protein
MAAGSGLTTDLQAKGDSCDATGSLAIEPITTSCEHQRWRFHLELRLREGCRDFGPFTAAESKVLRWC